MSKNIQSDTSGDENLNELLTQIAKKYLFIETLETQHRDCYDFHDVSVWSIKDALTAAFNAGRDCVQRKRKK